MVRKQQRKPVLISGYPPSNSTSEWVFTRYRAEGFLLLKTLWAGGSGCKWRRQLAFN